MKKVLSFILTIAMIGSVFAGFSIVNVSAHQNYTMDTITFDETTPVSTTNPTGYKYGTGNHTTTDGKYNKIEQNYGKGVFSAYHNSVYYYNDVVEAPDNRYGKSLLVRETWKDGAGTAYVQNSLTPNQTLYGTINSKASLYTEKNENDTYIQRAVMFRTKVVGSSYTNKQAVLFSHEGKGISVFGKGTGKTYKTDTWYDIDITYNMDTQQYHVVIYEDGVEYINVMGTDSGDKIDNIATMMLYHSPADSKRNDIKIYWDNLSINSADKFEISEASLYPTMSFDGLKDQEAGKSTVEGLPSTYTYRFGYQGNVKLPVLKALETDKGTSACVYGYPWTGEMVEGAAEGQYRYPQMIVYTKQAQFMLKASVKFQNTKLTGIYFNGRGTADIMFYGGITAFGQSLASSFDKTGNVWYDIELIMDTTTGYYEATLTNTSDNTSNTVSGFQTIITEPINEVKFGHDRGGVNEASMKNEAFYWIDDLYVGNYGVDDVEAEYSYDFEDGLYPTGYSVSYEGITMADLSAKSGEKGDVNIDFDTVDTTVKGFTPDAVDSFAIPFINDKPYYKITAKFTLEDLNSTKLIYFGNLPIVEIPTNGNVKCNQSARGKIAVVGNEYTVTHVMQPGCTVSSTSVTGVFADKADVQTISYGAGKPSGPFNPFKIVVKPTGVADTFSSLTLSDIKMDVKYKTSSTKNFRMESLEGNGVDVSVFLPYDKAGSGYVYTADLAFDNFDAERTIKIGDNTVASIDTMGNLLLGEEMALLEAGKVYELKINATHDETSTAVVSLAGVSTTVDASPYINVTQSEGVSLMTLDNVNYVAKIPFIVTSEEVIKDLPVDEDVTIAFSTALSDDVTKETFNVYKPNGAIADTNLIEAFDFEIADDKKSVTISFDKEKSTHYHIAFDVTDLFGASLSDFVEVNTEKPTVVTDAVKFYNANGDAVTTLPYGDVFAKINAYSGDGNTYDANMWIALYDEAGALKSVKFTPVEITPEEKELSTDIYVPENGKAYFVKAGIVLPNLKPVVFGKIHTQVIIIRLDDLKVGTMDAYSALTDWAADNEVALSIGMVCNSIDEDNATYIQTVKDMVNTGFVEIWCHGYDHQYHEGTGVTAEFTKQTAQYQAEVLRKCYDHVYEKTDGVVKLSCLGTPSGGMDENTFAALEMVPEFKANFGSTSVPYDGNGFANLTNSLWMEPSTGKLQTLDTLKGYYDSRTVDKEYMIFGCHAGYFDDSDMDTLKSFIEYLKTKELVFMTPSQYADFIG